MTKSRRTVYDKERKKTVKKKTDLKQNIFSFPFLFDLNEIDLSYHCASGI